MTAILGFFEKPDRTRIDEPTWYQIQGKAVHCAHCAGESFSLRTALLNTPGMTFFDLDWANRTATVLVCSQCSHIQWFLDRPSRREA